MLFVLRNVVMPFYRGDSNAGVNDRVLSQLLTEIDGIQVTIYRGNCQYDSHL